MILVLLQETVLSHLPASMDPALRGAKVLVKIVITLQSIYMFKIACIQLYR